MNDGREMVGDYYNDTGSHGFLATPLNDGSVVPIPPALPLFAGGLGFVGWIARCRRGQSRTLKSDIDVHAYRLQHWSPAEATARDMRT